MSHTDTAPNILEHSARSLGPLRRPPVVDGPNEIAGDPFNVLEGAQGLVLCDQLMKSMRESLGGW